MIDPMNTFHALKVSFAIMLTSTVALLIHSAGFPDAGFIVELGAVGLCLYGLVLMHRMKKEFLEKVNDETKPR